MKRWIKEEACDARPLVCYCEDGLLSIYRYDPFILGHHPLAVSFLSLLSKRVERIHFPFDLQGTCAFLQFSISVTDFLEIIIIVTSKICLD